MLSLKVSSMARNTILIPQPVTHLSGLKYKKYLLISQYNHFSQSGSTPVLFVLEKRTFTVYQNQHIKFIFNNGCTLRLPHGIYTKELNVPYNLLRKDPCQTARKDLTSTQKW